LTTLRENVGYVPQDVFLFSDSIANNISFGMAHANNGSLTEKIYEAAKDAVIYDNIMEFEKKFETMIGERGITLSGGQKQRVSIARALIKNPKILVFDDCLSAVDTHTEELILGNLKKQMEGKTSLIISHRVSTVKHAEKIIVLDAGKVVEKGNHHELLALRGLYFALYEKQLMEEEA
jgi:ATP-binding cassette subfamily B multidrug efflux pump